MGHGVVGFSLVLFGNPNVHDNSVERLFSMTLLPAKHSPDDSPDIVVRPSRMSWGFFLVAERSCFQLCLAPADNSGLCTGNNSSFSIQHNHLFSFEGLLRNIARHSSKNQI